MASCRIVWVLATLVLLILVPATRAAGAPNVRLLKDIASGVDGSQIGAIAQVGDTLFFIANDRVRGKELWKSDGTRAGTSLMKDIWPGPKGSQSQWDPRVSSLTDVGSTLFFAADDGTHGNELWRSDGTEAGTVMVKDIWPGGSPDPASSYPVSLINVGGTLYFSADDGIHGKELWRSDGTATGTEMVKDIQPGHGVFVGGPHSLTDVGGTLYFVAEDGTHGVELWRSDGTEAGTVMVKDIFPGPRPTSRYPALAEVGSTLYLVANDGTHGVELWRSDGTEAGTMMVKDIWPGSVSSWPGWLTDVGGTLYFSADDGAHGDELWKSDGTEAGTVMVKDIRPGRGGSYADSLTDVGGTLYFAADDGTHGVELWKSDGTDEGTVLVKDILPGSGRPYPVWPQWLTDIGGTLYFAADDGTHGGELWKSDGTEAGTAMVKDLCRGKKDSGPSQITDFRGTVFFSAYTPVTGRELWSLQAG